MGAIFLPINRLVKPLMICNFHISFMLQAVGKGSQSLVLSSCRMGLIQLLILLLFA